MIERSAPERTLTNLLASTKWLVILHCYRWSETVMGRCGQRNGDSV
jgi:hypothetical protein